MKEQGNATILEIRKAENQEFEKVRAFYHSLIDAMQDSPYDIGWKKDIYPSPEFLREAIGAGELYIGLVDGTPAAAMVLDHNWNEGYDRFQWPVQAQKDEITVIHALGVHPAFGGRGVGRQMVEAAIAEARQTQQKVIRLDVLQGNLPAEKLYEKAGFQKLHTLKQYYEDTGWAQFELYEYEVGE